MRSQEEMMRLILDRAAGDERIRAVTMEGSRANGNAVHDRYSDFDICYIVTGVREFTRDKSWLEGFGELLIAQFPNDWYDIPMITAAMQTLSAFCSLRMVTVSICR